jgi:uncharacterized protein YecE (DUF72 family)
MRAVHVGCSGWNYPHWRGRLYPSGLPPDRWLTHYAARFSAVEVNATFYRLPSPGAVAAWVAATPPGFVFAVKASRYLTHVKRLRDLDAGLARFAGALAPLVASPKLGPVLWQLPERFHRDDARLAAALAALPPGRHAFEFRHPSWFAPEVYALLRRRDAALVIGDHPKRPFQTRVLTADWTYVRFHYGRRGRGGNYSPAELAAWAARLDAWRRSVEVFAFFNNDWRGFAVDNARALDARLAAPRGRRGERSRVPRPTVVRGAHA